MFVAVGDQDCERDRDFWQNKCDVLESDIDRAVYKLYNLTPDEIALIEKG